MKILVTGGAGYIGSHIVKLLVSLGHEPIVLDNLTGGQAESLPNTVPLVVGSIGDSDIVSRVLRDNKISTVLHLAAFIEVAESIKYPEKYLQNNYYSALVLLEEARKAKVDRFIFSSTAAVYGSPKNIPILETNDCSPINPYGESKLLFENALLKSGIPSIIFRYFNVAGASEDGSIGEAHWPETHLIPKVLLAAKNRETVYIYGDDYNTSDGTCIRDYLHVEDIARAHVLGLEGKPGIYNLANAAGFSVKNIISACERVVNIPINVEIRPRRAGDPSVLIADCTKANKVLNWYPKFRSLNEIISHAWVWHNSKKYNDLIEGKLLK